MKINNIYKVCYRFTVFQTVPTRNSKVEVFTKPVSLLQSSDLANWKSRKSGIHGKIGISGKSGIQGKK